MASASMSSNRGVSIFDAKTVPTKEQRYVIMINKNGYNSQPCNLLEVSDSIWSR